MNKGIDDFLKMGCKEKHTPINEYKKRGGLKGYASQLFQDELSKAELDTKHCLHPTVEAIKRNDIEKASQLLLNTLMNLPEESPLNASALLLVTIPAIHTMVEQAKEHFLSGNDPALENYPKEIRDWGAMEAAIKDSNQTKTTKATIAKTIYSQDDKLQWQIMADAIDPERKNRSHTAKLIAQELNLPEEAKQIIRKSI